MVMTFNIWIAFILFSVTGSEDDNWCRERIFWADLAYQECKVNIPSGFDDYQMISGLVNDSGLTPGVINSRKSCSQQFAVVDCLEIAFEKVRDCFTLHQQNQFISQIEGLKIQRMFLCVTSPKLLLDNDVKESITECSNERLKEIENCKKIYNYSHESFLPRENGLKIFENYLWSPEDCLIKYNWLSCWIYALDKCENKSARNYFKDYFLNIFDVFPTCNSLLDKTKGKTLDFMKISLDYCPLTTEGNTCFWVVFFNAVSLLTIFTLCQASFINKDH